MKAPRKINTSSLKKGVKFQFDNQGNVVVNGVEYTDVYPKSDGLSYMYLSCPACDTQSKAYLWSYSASGKKCIGCGGHMVGNDVTFKGKDIRKKDENFTSDLNWEEL